MQGPLHISSDLLYCKGNHEKHDEYSFRIVETFSVPFARAFRSYVDCLYRTKLPPIRLLGQITEAITSDT